MANNTIEMGRFGSKSPNTMVSERGHSRADSESGGFFGLSTTKSSGRRQQMDRSFGSISILALSITLLASWESIASGFQPGLENGGPASLVWGMLLSMTGTMALALSLAEMASICPLAGAQYHWTAVLAPPRIKAFSTWMQGWITVFGWQAAVTSICFLVGAQIQGMLILNYPDYTPQRWQGTLLMWAVMTFAYVINVYAVKILPALQMVGGVMHVTFFIVLIIPLILLAHRSPPEFVFKTLLNEGGWKSDGISWCLGMLTVTYCFLGFDGAIHMSEEVRNPAKVIPRIIIQTIAINGTLAFVFILVLLFCIGDINAALTTPTGFPIIEIFYSATGSVRATTAMQCAITLIGFVSNIGVVASVSRLTWAFARDGGLPYSKYFAHVDPKYHVPKRAITLVSISALILSIINIGSSTALAAILALTTSSLYISYLIPIIMMILRRLNAKKGTMDPIEFGPWNLGRYGLIVNIYAVIFGTFVCIFVPFPTTIPVTAQNMNWCGPVFLGVFVVLFVDWLVRGRGKYVGPLRDLLQQHQVQQQAEEREDQEMERRRRQQQQQSSRGGFKGQQD